MIDRFAIVVILIALSVGCTMLEIRVDTPTKVILDVGDETSDNYADHRTADKSSNAQVTAKLK